MNKNPKTEYEEHWLLPLLKKVPTYETNLTANEKWSEESKEATNHLLGIFEEEQYVDVALQELRDEIKELTSKLERHNHLKDGTAVGKI